ncbi:MAG: response regulator [Candidatus Binataceae bacterium]
MAKQKAGPAKRTILIVDDEVGILEVLESILGDAGFAVVSAINGQDALTRMQKTVPDLVIVDFMMPLLDGAGVVKAMRADKRLRAVPVVLASALPEKTISERCNSYNVFLRKPYKTERLMEEISRLLDSAPPRSSKS